MHMHRDENDRCRILSQIHSGKSTEIVEARVSGAHGFEKLIALKRLAGTAARDDDVRRRFIHQAMITSWLSHPSILNVYNFFESPEGLTLEMEFFEGIALSILLTYQRRINQTVPARASVFFMSQLLDALDYIHNARKTGSLKRLDLVHRNICPDNILIDPSGAIKLIGFDNAQYMGMDYRMIPMQDLNAYQAPETHQRRILDARADLYSTAAVFYELLSLCRWPMTPDERERHEALDQLVGDAQVFRPLLESALSPQPDERPRHALEFSRMLRESLAELPPSPEPLGFWHDAVESAMLLTPEESEDSQAWLNGQKVPRRASYASLTQADPHIQLLKPETSAQQGETTDPRESALSLQDDIHPDDLEDDSGDEDDISLFVNGDGDPAMRTWNAGSSTVHLASLPCGERAGESIERREEQSAPAFKVEQDSFYQEERTKGEPDDEQDDEGAQETRISSFELDAPMVPPLLEISTSDPLPSLTGRSHSNTFQELTPATLVRPRPEGAPPPVPEASMPGYQRQGRLPEKPTDPATWTLPLVDASGVYLLFLSPVAGLRCSVPSSGLTIGRAHSNDLVLPDLQIAPRHGMLCWEAGRWWLRAARGEKVKVDGAFTQEAALHAGQVLEFGRHRCMVMMADSPPDAGALVDHHALETEIIRDYKNDILDPVFRATAGIQPDPKWGDNPEMLWRKVLSHLRDAPDPRPLRRLLDTLLRNHPSAVEVRRARRGLSALDHIQ